jgi:hypothetical protein
MTIRRISKINTREWVSGRAIRWALEDALKEVGPGIFVFTKVGTTVKHPHEEVIFITIEEGEVDDSEAF